MPMHDWTKVYSGLFHDFHQGWSITIRNALNGGLLPKGMSAFIEHKVGVVGDLLPDMPLFLSESYHVAVPLEAAYRTNWSTMTEDVQRIVETGVMPEAMATIDGSPGGRAIRASLTRTSCGRLRN